MALFQLPVLSLDNAPAGTVELLAMFIWKYICSAAGVSQVIV